MYHFVIWYIFRWDDATNLFYDIGIVPASENLVSASAQKFRILDKVIIDAADDMIIMNAEILHTRFLELSQEMDLTARMRGNVVASTTSLNQQLYDIKTKASALTAFATAIRDRLNRADTVARVAKLDVSFSS